jgi:superoxide reductase
MRRREMAGTKETAMTEISQVYKTDNWKTEKHVPVIECADSVKAGEMFQVNVTIGKEVAHPNKTEHHIRWIRLYFVPEGENTPYEIGNFEFCAHGASTKGPDTSTLYTNHAVTCWFKTDKAGTLLATSYCNIHGLWEYSKDIRLA